VLAIYDLKSSSFSKTFMIILAASLLFLPLTFSANNNNNNNALAQHSSPAYEAIKRAYESHMKFYIGCLNTQPPPGITINCGPPPELPQPLKPVAESCDVVGSAKMRVVGNLIIEKPCRPVGGECPPNHTKDKDGTLCWLGTPPKCGPNELYTRSSTGEIRCEKDFDTYKKCALKAAAIPKRVKGGVSAEVGEKTKIGPSVEAEWEFDEFKKVVYEQCLHENRIFH
jgi:hypothetical protein